MKQFPLKKKKRQILYDITYIQTIKRQTNENFKKTDLQIHTPNYRLAVGKERGKRQDRGRELRGTTHYVENK